VKRTDNQQDIFEQIFLDIDQCL